MDYIKKYYFNRLQRHRRPGEVGIKWLKLNATRTGESVPVYYEDDTRSLRNPKEAARFWFWGTVKEKTWPCPRHRTPGCPEAEDTPWNRWALTHKQAERLGSTRTNCSKTREHPSGFPYIQQNTASVLGQPDVTPKTHNWCCSQGRR